MSNVVRTIHGDCAWRRINNTEWLAPLDAADETVAIDRAAARWATRDNHLRIFIDDGRRLVWERVLEDEDDYHNVAISRLVELGVVDPLWLLTQETQ